MKLNVLNLISGLGQGGAEQVLLDSSKQFKNSKNIESSIISFSDEITLLSEFEKNNIDVRVLYKRKSLSDLYKMIFEISSYIKKHEIDIVHAHMSHAMMVAAILKIRFPKLKVIFTPHSVNFGNRLRETIIFLLKPFRNIDILFSKNMHQWFNNHKYQIIPNGIIVKDFSLNVDKYEKFTFIAIGNIKKAKNYPFLIECVDELKKSFDFQLFIVGDGRDRVLLEKEVRSKKLEQYVSIIGHKNNISELLAQSHCLVVPSLWEGMPLSILEAGASRIPIIATRVGSIPSVLDDNCAYLSDLDDFQCNMENVIQNYMEAEEKAERFYEKVKVTYTIEKTVESLENLYRNLLSCKH